MSIKMLIFKAGIDFSSTIYRRLIPPLFLMEESKLAAFSIPPPPPAAED
jgi:hypothetical protein